MQNILETMMLICFGFSWPISVIHNYRAATTHGMSVPFILLNDWYTERLRKRELSGGTV